LDSGNFSDLVLKCGDKEWKLHKSVVCCQSKFFHEACSGDFQVSLTVPPREQRSNVRRRRQHPG
jgi:hypothetical protein